MKTEQQQQARDLYLHTDKTQQEIADILSVNRRTVYLWIKNGRWDDMKVAARQAPGAILQDIYGHITAVNDKIRERDETDRCPSMEEVEKLRKLVGITAVIQKRNVGSYMEAFQELISFISRRDRDLAGHVIPHADSYVKGSFGDKIFHASKERDENIRDVLGNLKSEEETADIPHMPGVVTTPAPSGIPHVQNDAAPPDPAIPSGEQSAVALPTQPCIITPSLSGRVRLRPFPLCDNNEIFCDKNLAADSPVASLCEPSEPAATQHSIENEAQSEQEKYPAQEISGNGTFFTLGSPLDKMSFDKIMELPPAQRPSPWRDENIIWVTSLDHLEYRVDNFGNPWGEMKMSDTVRHYPDIDPALKRDQALTQMMKDIRDEENRSRPAA